MCSAGAVQRAQPTHGSCRRSKKAEATPAAGAPGPAGGFLQRCQQPECICTATQSKRLVNWSHAWGLGMAVATAAICWHVGNGRPRQRVPTTHGVSGRCRAQILQGFGGQGQPRWDLLK